MENTGLVISVIVLAAMLCQWLAWRVRLPAILFLLVLGLIAGPLTGALDPDQMFGDLLMPMVSLSVAIILFEGSLTLNIREISEVSSVVRRMVTVGALVTWGIVAVATYWIFDFSPQVSALFGAVVIVTGPTVIVPMLRTVRPTRRLANILRWEGIAIDPVGALMAVMTYEFILVSVEQPAFGHVIWLFAQTVLIGSLLGILAGYILGKLLAHNLLPEYLHNLATLSLVLIAFSVSNALKHESGLLAVTVMGMWLANQRDVDIHPILNFKEHLSVLLISVLFIVLAARIDLSQLYQIFLPASLLLLVLQFVARPAKILVCTFGSDLSWQERGLLSWIAPRGIVAAAISAIFAEKLISVGYTDAELLVPLTFFIIVGTVVLQSATARLVANGLGVAEPSPRGFLIVGANAFARGVAAALSKHDLRCVVADSNWENIRAARMAGLDTFYGNPVSEHADLHLDLSGVGGLLAMSHQRDINVVAAIHYRADFGAERVFSLTTSGENQQADKHNIAGSYKGSPLFGDEASYSKMLSLISLGYEFKSTTLSDEYSWQDYLQAHTDMRIPLFQISAKGLVQPFLGEEQADPALGATVIALCPPEDASLASNSL